MGDRRGQAAMEFLMTYGWALLVVLVAIGSLTFYFGYDSSSFASETCFFGPGLSCSDMLVNEDSISLKVTNSLGKDITSFSVSSDSCDITSDNPRLDNGKDTSLTLSGCSFTPGVLVDEDLSLTYTFIDSSLEHIKDAGLTAVVESGTSQSYRAGSEGNGYNSDGNTLMLYKFDEGDGNLVVDSSAHGIHGSFISRGELVNNGGAETGTTANFDNFDGVKTSGCNNGNYCFYKSGSTNVGSEEFIEIDYSKTYSLSGQFKSTGIDDKSKLFFGYVPFDENYEIILPQEVYPVTDPNTETILYESVSPGDTTILIGDGTNWNVIGSKYVAFDIDDSGSYNDLPNRHLSSKITDVVDRGGYWEVALEALANENFPVGTKIREHAGAGAYMYEGASNVLVPSLWTEYNGSTTGEHIFGIDYGKWWRGTKYAKIVFLLNFQQMGDYSLDLDDISITSTPVTYSNHWVPGQFGTSIEFNGEDDYVVIPYDQNMVVTDEFTLEFWLNPLDFYEGIQRIVGRSASWAATLNNGVISFHTNVDVVPKTITYQLPNENQWYHIAGTYDGFEMHLFVNGVEVNNGAQLGVLNPEGGTGVYIGANHGTGQFLKSLVDEIRVSDYVRYV